ncbi:helix-turn-helix domain-containing protein [Actinokineospora xionganensis]|uniref:Helix-turn-helix domain-containing protein n=1 Tax=Actinokineospora xionganensis TaxID=2684470 RepID=A0ABR7LBY5_9PSEU|nr:helix-turn-helix transcriptional regulator [Actinokineospora xionganensis]MBC6450211.1 helix-turn-helix domain-containing protein [Actinokineospora xionganensis]
MAGGDEYGSWPLGPFLNEARIARKLTQKAAAARASLSRTAWQQLESGQRADGNPVRPKATTVIAAAMAVDADPARALELAGLDPSAFEPSRAGRPATSFAEARALLAQLTEPQRRAVIDLLRTIVHDTPAEPFREDTTLSGPERTRWDATAPVESPSAEPSARPESDSD